MRLGDLDDLKDHIAELLLVYSGEELVNAILNAIDNAHVVIKCGETSEGLPFMDLTPNSGYNQAIKDITKYVQDEKKYYTDGTMCSMSESIIGENICDDILKYLKDKDGDAE